MHDRAGLHVRIGNCSLRGIRVQQSGRRLSSRAVSVPTSQLWGGGKNTQAEGCTDSSFTHNISPPSAQDKGSDFFMPDGKQRQQFKTICIPPHHHLSVSASWQILKHNPFGAPTGHNISLRPPTLPRSGRLRVVAGSLQQVRQSNENLSLLFE